MKAEDGELQTDWGIFKLDDLLELDFGDVLTSHLGVELKVYRPRAQDFFEHLKRTGAPISPKDVGIIMSHTGINKDDTVLDAGTGSGILAIYLGLAALRVVTYEVSEDFIGVARSNIAAVGLENVDVRLGDIAEEIHSLNETFDVVTLDLQSAAKVVPAVPGVLNPGGYLVVFSPFIEHAKEVRYAVSDAGLEDTVTLECTLREMSFKEKGTRPSTSRVGHTGYLTFARLP